MLHKLRFCTKVTRDKEENIYKSCLGFLFGNINLYHKSVLTITMRKVGRSAKTQLTTTNTFLFIYHDNKD